MKKFSISPGLLISKENVLFELKRRVNGDKLIFESVIDGDVWTIEKNALLLSWKNSELSIVASKVSNDEVEVSSNHGKADIQDLDCFGEKNKAIALMRYAYVDAVLKHKTARNRKEAILETIEIVAKDRNEKTPSKTSVYQWVKKFEESDQNIHSLINNYSACGRPAITGKTKELLDFAVIAVYLTLERNNAHDVWEHLDNAIAAHNKVKPDEPLICPDESTVRRHIKRLNAWDTAVARHGKKEATRLFRSVLNGKKTHRILEEVQMDHGLCNLFVVDDELMLPLGRPQLTAARDTDSKMPFGLYISFSAGSLHSVFSCLRQGILPKDELRKNMPSIEGDWPVWGIPETLKLDNSPEFHSPELLDAARELGISLTWCPAYEPWFKGGIERYIKEQNMGLLEKLPGTTFSNLFERKDYQLSNGA